MTASRTEIVGWITDESDAFASVLAGADLDARVPGCPEWSLRELAGHLGRVQRFWANVIRAGVDETPNFADDPDAPPAVPLPAAPPELEHWMRESTRALLDAIDTAAWDAPAWVWWKEPRTAGAIARHQVQEVAVHRWDAQSAVGSAEPLPADLAGDALAEFVGNMRDLRSLQPIELRPDGGDPLLTAGGSVVAVVRGAASDLLLWCHGRIPSDAVRIDGDADAVAAFLVPIA